jgi:hypothetical protein
MSKSLISIYKLPIMISVVLTIVMLAMGPVRTTYDITAVIVGVFLGTLVLDMEYVLNAYFLDTNSDFSKTLVGFIRHSDWSNALRHIYYHRDESRENSLNSALFQMVLALMSIFVVYSTRSYFAKALILSVFTQSIYVLFEYYFKDRTNDWFWALSKKPTRKGVQTYIFVMLLILSFCLYSF